MVKKVRKYLINILITIDQAVNTVLAGDPDETLSSRMGKHLDTCKICRVVCWVLDHTIFFWDKPHCINSIENDAGEDDLLT